MEHKEATRSIKLYTDRRLFNQAFGQPAKRVGEGTFGIVHQTDKNYARKTEDNDTPEKGIQQQILKEIVTLKQLSHPNIIPILGIHMSNDQFKFAIAKTRFSMPLAETDLNNLINKITIDRIEMKKAIYQIVRGLAYCHTNSIWHLDIKSGNIVRFKDGRYAIIDFGKVETFAINGKWHDTNAVTTLWWKAPEILIKDHYYTEKADLWSVGITMLQMIIGESLFRTLHTEEKILEFICWLIGTPTNADLPDVESHLTAYKIKKYTSELDSSLIKNSEDLQFLQQLLTWPTKRLTAIQALQNSYFDDVRLEIEQKFPVSIISNKLSNLLSRQVSIKKLNISQQTRLHKFSLLWSSINKYRHRTYHVLFLTYIIIDLYAIEDEMDLDLVLVASYNIASKLVSDDYGIDNNTEMILDTLVEHKLLTWDDYRTVKEEKFDIEDIIRIQQDILIKLELNLLIATCINFTDYLRCNLIRVRTYNLLNDLMVIIITNNQWITQLSQYEIACSAINIINEFGSSIKTDEHSIPDNLITLTQIMDYIELNIEIELFKEVKDELQKLK